SNYRYGYMPLACAADDAMRICTRLKTLGCLASVCAVDAGAGDVQRDEVVSKLKKTADACRESDTLLFFFAGHGKRCGKQDYLICSDTNPAQFEKTALALNRLGAILATCKAKRRI